MADISEVEALRKRIEELELELSQRPPAQESVGRNYENQKYVPKTPLGMRDYMPHEMIIREKVFGVIKEVFKRHGAVSIETPVTELKATLTGKYGEDSKLIYDLANQGGEILALRYDLTVPFARFCAQHNIENIKRYHIARVYRRDRPVMAKGRYREFYQCDIDIAGTYESMIPDAECVKIVQEILTELGISPFIIKVNHRMILDGIFQVCGVKDELLRTISSAVDKLDKSEWTEVRTEMLEKGITGETADKIWSYVRNKGGMELVTTLRNDPSLSSNSLVKKGIEDIEKLLIYCKALNVDDNCILFDLSLARGLDYYTGVIYEAILPDAGVGSVAGGGRYDNLVGMFKKKGKTVPCVGISIGIERLFGLVEEMESKSLNRKTTTQVLVVSVAPGKADREPMLLERMRILSELWKANIHCEMVQKLNPKALSQFQLCQDEGIPYAVIIGPDEVSKGEVKIRDSVTREETVVKRGNMVESLKSLLSGKVNSPSPS